MRLIIQRERVVNIIIPLKRKPFLLIQQLNLLSVRLTIRLNFPSSLATTFYHDPVVGSRFAAERLLIHMQSNPAVIGLTHLELRIQIEHRFTL